MSTPVPSLAKISRPSGAGKTTQIAWYVRQLAAPVLWHTVDPADDDPATLSHHLARAGRPPNGLLIWSDPLSRGTELMATVIMAGILNSFVRRRSQGLDCGDRLFGCRRSHPEYRLPSFIRGGACTRPPTVSVSDP